MNEKRTPEKRNTENRPGYGSGSLNTHERPHAAPPKTGNPGAEKSAPRNAENGGAGDKRTHRQGSVILFRALVAVAALMLSFLIVRGLLLFVEVKMIVLSGESYHSLEELCDAASLSEGNRMFGTSKGKLKKAMLEEYPLLSDVKIRRALDGTLTLTPVEVECDFYVNVSGTYCVLSREGFRVLLQTEDAERLSTYGLYEISLPDVRVAFLGETLKFGEEKSNEYVGVLLDALDASALADRITGVRAAERFNLSIIVDGKYDVSLGSVSDLKRKLDYFTVIECSDRTDVFASGSDAEINLTDLNAPTVRAVDAIDKTVSG